MCINSIFSRAAVLILITILLNQLGTTTTRVQFAEPKEVKIFGGFSAV